MFCVFFLLNVITTHSEMSYCGSFRIQISKVLLSLKCSWGMFDDKKKTEKGRFPVYVPHLVFLFSFFIVYPCLNKEEHVKSKLWLRL